MLYPQINAHRDLQCLDGLYRFVPDRNNVSESEGWHAGLPTDSHLLAVPGSWNEQLREVHDFHGEGWYEHEVHIPKSWTQNRILLRIGSTSGNARVFWDGHFLGEHIGPHLPFEFDVTDLATPCSKHRLVIAVDNTLRWMSLPPGQARREEDRAGFGLGYPDVPYDFFPYGGIHRSISLAALPTIHISDIRVQTDYSGSAGLINFECRVAPAEASCTLRVKVGEQQAEFPVKDGFARGSLQLEAVRLWSHNDPHLYDVSWELLGEGEEPIDSYCLPVGVRKVEVCGDQLLLNGKPVHLKGFGKHEDFPILGKAWAPAVAVKDFDLMRWIGANSFRTSHYPYADEMLSLADRLGFLVISETPFVSLSDRLYTDEMLDKAQLVIRELIGRDYNHPSVIMWSLANEPYVETDAGEHFFRSMAECARSEDATRPIMYVAHEGPEQNRGAEHFDLLGVNKYFGWYHETGDIDGSLPKLKCCLEEFHEHCGGPILLAEFGADAVAGLHSDPPVLFSEEYQAETIVKQYELVKDIPWIIGAHIWNFADFKTAQTINRVGGNKKGIFTRDRQPKLAAHAVRNLWRTATSTES